LLLAADAAGNVIVAAGTGGQLELFGEVITGSDDGDVVVAKLDAGGALLWRRMVPGAGDGPVSLAVGPEHIFVAGSKLDVFVATVSLDGAAASSEHFLVPKGEGSFGIAQSVTAVGATDVVIAGMFEPKLEFACGSLDAQSGPDIFVARLRGGVGATEPR
jgi:hypothetical protein